MKLTHFATFSTFIHAVLQEHITYGSDVIQISCFQKVGGTSMEMEMEDLIVVFGFAILFLYTIIIVIVGLFCLWAHWDILPKVDTDVEEI